MKQNGAQEALGLARIREMASRGTLPHALLFTGSGDRLSAARYAAAALECTEAGNRPCGVCAACRKVRQDIHPDVITVRDEAHKTIAMDVVRAVRSDAGILPNEGARKVYIVPDCSILTEPDQNVLLKVVEEGPAYAAFLFCAENPATVLQTLRSRCAELKLPAEETADAVDETGLALCRRILERRRGAVAELTATLESKRISREELGAALAYSRTLLAAALLAQYGKAPPAQDREIAAVLAKALTKTQIMRTIELLQTYCRDCAYNVGVNHVLGALAVELEDIL